MTHDDRQFDRSDEENVRMVEFERASRTVMGGARGAFLRALAGSLVLIAFVFAYATFGELAIWTGFAALFGLAAFWLRRVRPVLAVGNDR